MKHMYRHKKTGRFYKRVCIAQLERDPEQYMVVYEGNGHIWVRPEKEFEEKFDRVDIDRERISNS